MIGNSINELISIAERQSDERLAQELNPQTETGMLGPTWLPASELAFRQKIRAEAQAQPQNNPPVVQQLAQASAPPMMPQQMPQQMPPQMMAEGGLVGYANGGYVDVGQRLGPLMSPDDLLRRNFPQYFPVSPDQQIVDDAIDQLMDNQPNIADQANLNAQLAMGERNLIRNREDEMLENRLTNMERQSEQYNQSSRPTIIGKDQVSGISGLNPDDIRNAGNLDIDDQGNIIKDNIYPNLEETLTERAKIRGGILPGILSGMKNIAGKSVQGYLDFVGPEILASEGLDPNLYDSDLVNSILSGNKNQKQGDDIKGDDIPIGDDIYDMRTAMNEIEANERKVLEEISNQDGTPKGPITNINADGTNVNAKASTVKSSTTGTALQNDVLLAEQQRLDELKEQIFKGNMDRKWMAIAAGAFNAAQRGAPTLMQGLADLGGDVTGELQKLDKEDQDRALALYEIYLQEATLAEAKRKTDLTYEAAMYGHSIDSLQNIADRIGKDAKEVLDATKAFDTAKKNKTLGDFGTEQYIGSVIDYADLGVVSAALDYNQEIGKLNAKEKEILADIEDFDPNNPDHIKEAREEMTEYLNDNPSMKLLYNDYWSKRATQDEKGQTIPFDISSSLIIRPPTG